MRLSLNVILWLSTSKCSVIKFIKRSFIVFTAFSAAMPFKSVPLEAAVGEVFGTLSVRVALILTALKSTPKPWATICAILVFSPWPISVPPWFKCIEPSLYTCTNAPAWFKCCTVNDIPYLTGVIARPFFIIGDDTLNALIASLRAQ